MNGLETIAKETAVLPGAASQWLNHPAPRGAALVLHGYTGYVGDMMDLARRLNENGFIVMVPRLSGHGTNRSDFQASDHRAWWRNAIDAYLACSATGLPVAVAGLSMGGLLATLLAAQFPVARLALLAPAFRTVSTLVPWTPLLQYLAAPRKKAESQVEEQDNPERRYLAQEYWDWQWPRQTAQLYALIRRARRALGQVTCPTLTIASRADSAVPISILELVTSRIAAADHREVILEESRHVITRGCDQLLVEQEVVSWFRMG